ncbi:sugar phosphate isomerase/epimerase family protein [Alkalicoccus chagannorensis]|uniref:sugar phosphate isomerase/epimerase family protein n=1 Tax=Alkalicoccus chagannorensis TaxID=427072 RepID=UPI000404BE7B|nr:hypothetical protein [Alkalicoccus chagannorensis]
MHIKIMKSLWGMEAPIDEILKSIHDQGYDGVEGPLVRNEDRAVFKELLKAYQLDFIPQINTQGDHSDSFQSQVYEAMSFNPLKINSHSGKDSMRFKDKVAFFHNSIEIEKQMNIPISHETHRSRILFTPWETAEILKEVPELRITADFSHWCCVCERMLDDFKDELDIAIRHTEHIHGRVGFEQGPQVSDPRAPEFQPYLLTFEKWWQQIYDFHQQQHASSLTFTPEYGPPHYLQTIPYTKQPMVDLDELCLEMGSRFKSMLKK